MNQSFRFGYAAGQQAVNHLSNMTRQEASQKIPSVILSVLTFVLGFLLAESMATFGWYMVFDMLEAWAIICVLWFIPCLVILLLRLESTFVKKKMIFRYVGKNMGLYSVASIAVFSVVAAILGRIYNGDSSSIMVWILPVFPITLPIWLNRRFKFVLTKGARAVEEQYSAYQHERMNLFLARAKEHFGLDSFTPQIFEGYTHYDLVKEAASAPASMFYYDDNRWLSDEEKLCQRVGRYSSDQHRFLCGHSGLRCLHFCRADLLPGAGSGPHCRASDHLGLRRNGPYE